jgi:hypothetical protein
MAMGFGPNLSNTSPNILTKELCLVGNWSYVPSHIVLKKIKNKKSLTKRPPITFERHMVGWPRGHRWASFTKDTMELGQKKLTLWHTFVHSKLA